MLSVEAARDHGKSWMFSYSWPLFNVQRVLPKKEPINIALISYSEEQARKNLVRIRKTIEVNDWLQWLIPKSKSYVWDSGMLNTSNDCTIETFGFGSSVRGGHYHLVVIDDPTKDHWTMTLAEQENFLYGVIVPAVRRGHQLVVCGNPVEKQDLLERLEHNPSFKHVKYPALNDRGEPLWPEQYTVEDLLARRSIMPAHQFAREYLLRRVSSENAKFREEWIRYYRPDDLAGKPLHRIMTIDPALSPGGDAMAAVVTGTDTNLNTYILDRLSFRGDFRTGIGYLCDMISRHHLDRIGCETFAFQRMYKIYLEEEIRKRGLSAWVEETGKDSHKAKSARIESLQPKIAGGKILFRREEDKPLVDQLLLWDPASKTNEDDEIDALSWQVPMWRGPFGDEVPLETPVVAGSWQEAFDENLMNRDAGWIKGLFEDLNAPSA